MTTSCNFLQGSANDRPLFMRTNMNPALIICPSEQQKNLRMRKEVKNWDAPLTGCVVVFVFEEISLMVFSINEGSFNF